jgi:hypothetical protein
MPAAPSRTALLRQQAHDLLRAELTRLGRTDFDVVVCFSDASWREAMLNIGCPAYTARLASPTTRRGTRGKLGMATICHIRHGHAGVTYVKLQGRTWDEIADTVRHEALHLARPSFNHRQVEAALYGTPVAPPRRRLRRRQRR